MIGAARQWATRVWPVPVLVEFCRPWARGAGGPRIPPVSPGDRPTAVVCVEPGLFEQGLGSTAETASRKWLARLRRTVRPDGHRVHGVAARSCGRRRRWPAPRLPPALAGGPAGAPLFGRSVCRNPYAVRVGERPDGYHPIPNQRRCPGPRFRRPHERARRWNDPVQLVVSDDRQGPHAAGRDHVAMPTVRPLAPCAPRKPSDGVPPGRAGHCPRVCGAPERRADPPVRGVGTGTRAGWAPRRCHHHPNVSHAIAADARALAAFCAGRGDRRPRHWPPVSWWHTGCSALGAEHAAGRYPACRSTNLRADGPAVTPWGCGNVSSHRARGAPPARRGRARGRRPRRRRR